MSLQDLIGHPRAIRWGLWASRHASPATAGRVARGVARLLTLVEPDVVRILKDNLRQVLGPAASRRELEATARRVFYHFVRGYYDLFRALQLPPEEVLSWVQVPAWVVDALRGARDAGRGVLVVTGHVGNFDLGAQVVAAYAPRVQVISLPDPSPGFMRLNEIRRRGGAEVTPLSPGSLRQALRTLRQGGVVAVGADRPVSDLDDEVPFFGRPARVPSAHVRLALKTDALVLVLCCTWNDAEDGYRLHVEPFLDMVRTGDAQEELAINMRRVLSLVEGLIRRCPEQWFMFVPVWPGAEEA